MNNTTLEKLRRKLLDLKEELEGVEKTGNEGAGIVELDPQAVGRISRMDDMRAQSMSKEAKSRRTALLQSIAIALEKMDKGAFGRCVYCQQEIPLPRIEFDPTLQTCVTCAGRG